MFKKTVDSINLLSGCAKWKMRNLQYQSKWGPHSPSAYDLIEVNPSEINLCTLPSLISQLNSSRVGTYITEYDWEINDNFDGIWFTRYFDPPVNAEFNKHALFISIKNHFENDIPWSSTLWHRFICENPNKISQYSGKKLMEKRFAGIDKLYNSIKSEGYKTQRQLLKSKSSAFKPKKYPSPEHYEVDVNIGASGDFYFNFNGRHRLAIAKILDLEKIPVRVFARSSEWQKKKKKVLDNKSSELIGHPDVAQHIN